MKYLPRISAAVAVMWFAPICLCAIANDEHRARSQPSIPDGWTETPFEETASEPALSQSEQEWGYMIFHRPITEPVHPNTVPHDHERVTTLDGFGTPGEFEPLTFSLYPVRKLKNLTVHCSDLSSSTGRIAASRIDIRLLTYWNIRFPAYTSDATYRRLPELLERVSVHSSPAKECQRWWMTIQVPEHTQPGMYKGTVSVQDDGFEKPVIIPIRFRVLGFRLKRDPQKHLSAYYDSRSPTMFHGRDKIFIDRAVANECQSMIDHGMDMLPTFYLQYDHAKEKIVVHNNADVDRMLASGMNGPLPLLGGNAIEQILLKTTPGARRLSHWALSETPSQEFYQRVTDAFSQLKEDCVKRGWPEIICCPLDEVATSSQDFGTRVYQAVHQSGVRTYATKNPLAVDSAQYRPFVDVWCSQPFAIPHEKVIEDRNHEYWSYPNHNATEKKNRRVMCKGGRMTYGFGFWRSGYTTLIPWHWAWAMPPGPFDYLRSSESGSGQRIDEEGSVIPAVYWECFREGYDDARYLYTLQQTLWDRIGSSDEQCQREIQQARSTLQETWSAIDVQEKYLAENVWPSAEFGARRWLIASQIERLRKFPAHRSGIAPSVLIDVPPSTRTSEIPISQHTEIQENLETFDLSADFDRWESRTPESSLEIHDETQPVPSLNWTIHMDHHAGGSADGDHHVGWPRILRQFNEKQLDMSNYDFLEMVVSVDSDRNEVQDDTTILGLTVSSHDGDSLYESSRDLGDQQRQDVRLQFSIPEMIREADKGEDPWKSIAYVQFYIAEANYPHGTTLRFDIKNVRLLRFKTPTLSRVDVPGVITLPQRNLRIPFEVMGDRSIRKDSHRLSAVLVDANGRNRCQASIDLFRNRSITLPSAGLRPGHYRIVLTVSTDGKPSVHQTSRGLTVINGPWSLD